MSNSANLRQEKNKENNKKLRSSTRKSTLFDINLAGTVCYVALLWW